MQDIALGQAVLVGLIAGLIGTAIFTVVEMIDIKVTGRSPSTVPGQVGVRLMGRDIDDNPDLVRKLNPFMHWGHGTLLGAVRGLLGATALAFWPATIVFYLLVEGGDALLYRVLGVEPWPWKWSRSELVRELSLKAVLALAISGVFAALTSLL